MGSTKCFVQIAERKLLIILIFAQTVGQKF